MYAVHVARDLPGHEALGNIRTHGGFRPITLAPGKVTLPIVRRGPSVTRKRTVE